VIATLLGIHTREVRRIIAELENQRIITSISVISKAGHCVPAYPIEPILKRLSENRSMENDTVIIDTAGIYTDEQGIQWGSITQLALYFNKSQPTISDIIKKHNDRLAQTNAHIKNAPTTLYRVDEIRMLLEKCAGLFLGIEGFGTDTAGKVWGTTGGITRYIAVHLPEYAIYEITTDTIKSIVYPQRNPRIRDANPFKTQKAAILLCKQTNRTRTETAYCWDQINGYMVSTGWFHKRMTYLKKKAERKKG